MKQSKIVSNKEIFWEIDLEESKKIQYWVNQYSDFLIKDIYGMKKYFPRWFLTVSKPTGEILTCSKCKNTLIPLSTGIRCIACGSKNKIPKSACLSWTGHIPTLVSGRTKVFNKIKKSKNPSLPLIEVNNKIYLLTPIVIVYPNKYPFEEPHCFYTQEFFNILGTPQSGHYIHMLGGKRMCLFAYNEWNSISIHEVIQQRIINHLISIIKIADGISPNKAFI